MVWWAHTAHGTHTHIRAHTYDFMGMLNNTENRPCAHLLYFSAILLKPEL